MTRTLISCCVALLLSPAVALADTRIDERHTWLRAVASN